MRFLRVRIQCWLLVLASVFLGESVAEADNLPSEVAAAYRSARTFTADLSLTMTQGARTWKVTGSVNLQKPNLVRVELTGAFRRTIVCNGRTEWVHVPEAKHCLKKEIHRFYARNFSVLWAQPVRLFFEPENVVFVNPAMPTSRRNLAPVVVGGTRYRVVEFTSTASGELIVRYFIGPNNLVRRMTGRLKDQGEVVDFEAALTNIQVNRPIQAQRFSYTPPAGARVFDPGDTQALDRLVTVGSKAPNFRLPLSSGGEFALYDALRNNKAVLLNYWFLR